MERGTSRSIYLPAPRAQRPEGKPRDLEEGSCRTKIRTSEEKALHGLCWCLSSKAGSLGFETQTSEEWVLIGAGCLSVGYDGDRSTSVGKTINWIHLLLWGGSAVVGVRKSLVG